MPRKVSEKESKLNISQKIKESETAISMSLGIIVLVLVGALIYRYFRNINVNKKSGVEETPEKIEESQTVATPEEKNLPQKYLVQEGDTLWKISEKFYGYGYNWVDIAKANKIQNPNQIEKGEELQIPEVPVRKPVAQKSNIKTIEGDKYQVVKGDTLWEISVRAYQDGFRWVEIAKANKLANPNLIHPGNVLIIPR